MRNFAASVRDGHTRARKLVALAQRPFYWKPLIKGVAGAVEHEQVQFESNFATVLDVGASRGQFALFARRRFPGARIACFEPLPGPRTKLLRTLGDSIEIHGFALGAEPMTSTLHVSHRDDSSSLLPITKRQTDEFPGTDETGQINVEVKRLDEVVGPLARPCLLKVDVQGYELEVLRGARQTLEVVDEAFIECSFAELYANQPLADEVICYLREVGFELVGAYGLVHSSRSGYLQADLHFRKRGRDPR